jgi:hypothetical protein
MREQPSGPELLAAVADFLRDEVLPRLDGRTGFHARVAVNVLEIVQREMTLGPAAEAQETGRLRALLGTPGDAAELTRELCARIAAGRLDPADPALVRHLWATTLATVAIDQPNYATYRRAAAEQTPD